MSTFFISLKSWGWVVDFNFSSHGDAGAKNEKNKNRAAHRLARTITDIMGGGY